MRPVRDFLALSSAALALAGCRPAPAVTLTPDDATTLSGCVVTFRASVEPAGDTGTFSWFVDGERLPGESGDSANITARADGKAAFTVSVRYARGLARAGATASVRVEPVPFRDPRESGLSFSERPVIAREENQLVDPGAMVIDGQRTLTVYNAIARGNEIHFGYAESEDGRSWNRATSASAPLLDKARVATAIGATPSNIHAKTLRREGDGWALYFTAANAGDYFFGNVFRATANEPSGPWTVRPEPCFPGARESWFAGNLGLPQVFDADSGGLRMYCATRAGGLVAAESTGAGRFVVTGPELPGVFHPAIAKTAWGWVMVSEAKIYLSLDGRSWHRYGHDLYTPKDLEDRGIETIVITSLVERDGVYRYYVEGMSDSRSDVWLVGWGD